ncbi:hypothetical protein [Streptomyces sp. IBSBF 2435]|uniref:hypothetical protein n=1 Tax=Streptomyces sp. IBSBF 2435 TaxID=2903531 RepID=UPI002FDBCAD3
MTHRYYVFGSATGTPAGIGPAIALALGAECEVRDSSYAGGAYCLLRGADFDRLTVEANWEDDDGCLAEPDYPDARVLLYLTNPAPRVLETLSALPDVAELSALVLD